MADSDDDTPPPLSSIADQLDALRIRQGSSTPQPIGAKGAYSALTPPTHVTASSSPACSEPQITLPASSATAGTNADSEAEPSTELLVKATVTVVPQQAKRAAKPQAPAIKRGFFDQRPRKKAPRPKPAKENEVSEEIEEIPVLKAQPRGVSNGPHIPDFMRLPPDAQEKQYAQMKSKIVDALKPTRDTVQDVLGNPALLAGFEDPEVMAAVADVATDPENMKKYQTNPKVVAFYKQMGSVMAARCDKLAAEQERSAAK